MAGSLSFATCGSIVVVKKHWRPENGGNCLENVVFLTVGGWRNLNQILNFYTWKHLLFILGKVMLEYRIVFVKISVV